MLLKQFHAFRSNYNGIDVQEIMITDRVLESYVTVGQLANKKYRIVLLGVHKKNKKRFFFNPIDSTVLEVGDYILVIGNTQFLKEFSVYLQKKGSNA